MIRYISFLYVFVSCFSCHIFSTEKVYNEFDLIRTEIDHHVNMLEFQIEFDPNLTMYDLFKLSGKLEAYYEMRYFMEDF